MAQNTDTITLKFIEKHKTNCDCRTMKIVQNDPIHNYKVGLHAQKY